MNFVRAICYTLLFFLYGCNSHIPALIKTPPEENIKYQQVKNNTDKYTQQYVRWGGKIVAVENREKSTWVEILASPLNSFGRPEISDHYQGRFIAIIDGFLDPEHYTKDRHLTIYGEIDSNIIKNIDEHPYNYPIIYTKEYYLWNKRRVSHYQYADYYELYPRYYNPYFHYPYSRYHIGLHRHYW